MNEVLTWIGINNKERPAMRKPQWGELPVHWSPTAAADPTVIQSDTTFVINLKITDEALTLEKLQGIWDNGMEAGFEFRRPRSWKMREQARILGYTLMPSLGEDNWNFMDLYVEIDEGMPDGKVRR